MIRTRKLVGENNPQNDIVRQVLVERRVREHAELLQLDDRQRRAVDETNQIRPACVRSLIGSYEGFRAAIHRQTNGSSGDR